MEKDTVVTYLSACDYGYIDMGDVIYHLEDLLKMIKGGKVVAVGAISELEFVIEKLKKLK